MNEVEDPGMMYPGGGSNIHAGAITQLTNPEESILLMEDALKGIKRVGGKPIKVGDPLLNKDGINSVISQMRSLVNQVSILSFLEDSEIKMLVHDNFGRALIRDLMLNRVHYEINDPSARSKIVSMAQSVAYNTLKRALKGNDKNFWSKTTMNFNSNIHGGKEDGGLMSKVNLFKSR